MQTQNSFSKSIAFGFLKLLILGLASYSIYDKIDSFDTPLPTFSLLTILILLIISSLNWIAEIIKWKLLVSTLSPLSFYEALKQSLTAHTTAIITPNKIGEYGAKALFFPKEHRKKILGYTFIGNSYQMLATTVFGILGLIFYPYRLFKTEGIIYISIFLGVSLVFGTYLQKKKNIFKFFFEIEKQTHYKTALTSFIRYLIFSFQYIFILYLLGVSLQPALLLPIIWLIYFISSCVPSFALFDFVIKGSVALFLFKPLSVPIDTILATAFLMWLFNFAIPALLGGFFLSTYKHKSHLNHGVIK